MFTCRLRTLNRRLVENRLKKVYRHFPALCPKTFDDFHVVADKPSAIVDMCQMIPKSSAAQNEAYDTVAAFEQVGCALGCVVRMVSSNKV